MNDRKPIDWALLPMKRYAQFSGRAPRAEYWWFYLATLVIGWVIAILDIALGTAKSFGDTGILGLLFTLATFVPSIAVTVRRFHDTNRSGLWLLGFVLLFIPLGLAILLGEKSGEAFSAVSIGTLVVGGLALVIVGIMMFVFCVTRGDIGENRYGDDPYGPSNLEEVFA